MQSNVKPKVRVCVLHSSTRNIMNKCSSGLLLIVKILGDL